MRLCKHGKSALLLNEQKIVHGRGPFNILILKSLSAHLMFVGLYNQSSLLTTYDQSNDSEIITKVSRSTTHRRHKSLGQTFFQTRQAYYNHGYDHTSPAKCCLQAHEHQHAHRAGEKKNPVNQEYTNYKTVY